MQTLRPISRWAPQGGWPWLLGLWFITGGLGAAGWFTAVKWIYPCVVLLVGAVLSRMRPASYIEFAWWIWFTSPAIRRIVDYRLGGYDSQNLITLSPYVVSVAAAPWIIRRSGDLKSAKFVPWFLAVAALLYGYAIGLARSGPFAATHSLVSWLAPLAFGLYCALQWRDYPACSLAVKRAFVVGCCVLAVYGIIQFVNPSVWDRMWVEGSQMRSVGLPVPFRIRVFGLLNSPTPYAMVLAAGLMVGLSIDRLSTIPFLISVLVALLLSLVRSVWIASAVSLLVFLSLCRRHATIRPLLATAVAGGCIALAPILLPSGVVDPLRQVVVERFLTFGDLEGDISFQDRASFFEEIGNTVSDEPLGFGLGSTGTSVGLAASGDGIMDFDNGLMAVLYSLGWIAGTVFLVSIMCIVGLCFWRMPASCDLFSMACRVIVGGMVLLAVGGNVFQGLPAAIVWGFAGVALAASTWFRVVATDPHVLTTSGAGLDGSHWR